jgi:hypothetical protein
MKKINNYFLMAALVATSFTFGCKKDTTNVVPSNGSATISGIVKYDFNIVNDTTPQGAFLTTYDALPAGLVITAEIDTKNLVLNPVFGTTYPKKEYRSTINLDGTYSITVDANSVSVPVKITVAQFRHDRITGPKTKPVITSTVYQEEILNPATSVVAGDNKIVDITSLQ